MLGAYERLRAHKSIPPRSSLLDFTIRRAHEPSIPLRGWGFQLEGLAIQTRGPAHNLPCDDREVVILVISLS
jgi:hypothetical protein